MSLLYNITFTVDLLKTEAKLSEKRNTTEPQEACGHGTNSMARNIPIISSKTI